MWWILGALAAYLVLKNKQAAAPVGSSDQLVPTATPPLSTLPSLVPGPVTAAAPLVSSRGGMVVTGGTAILENVPGASSLPPPRPGYERQQVSLNPPLANPAWSPGRAGIMQWAAGTNRTIVRAVDSGNGFWVILFDNPRGGVGPGNPTFLPGW